jgi:hypothetical protein
MMMDKIEESRHQMGSRIGPGQIRLFVGLAFAIIVCSVLMMSFGPSSARNQRSLSDAFGGVKASEIDSEELAHRIVSQQFQIHMQESDQGSGEIPSVEVWVLNDPFYPLMGKAGDLRSTDKTLSSKEWQMLGFPSYQSTQPSSGGGTTTTTTGSQATAAASADASAAQRVVIVQEIYEVRGIQYGKVKVNDTVYDKLKAGSDFADVFKVKEIKDNSTMVIVCGDEEFELQVGQLRKI